MNAAPEIPVVAPAGALDLHTSRDLGARLGELAGTSGNAVLDLSDVGFIDSMGLGVVIKAATRFHRQDKRLIIVAPDAGAVNRMLELAGMRDRLAIAPTREDALARAARAA